MGIYRRSKTNLIHYYYSKGTLNHIVYESPKYYYIASDLDARAKMYQYARQFELHMKYQTRISGNSSTKCARDIKKMKDVPVEVIPNGVDETLKHEELDDIFELNFRDFETELNI